MFNIFKAINKFVILALIIVTLLRVIFKAFGIEGFYYIPPVDILVKLTFAITDIYVEAINKVLFTIHFFLPGFTNEYFPIIELKSKAYIFEWGSLISILALFIIGIVIEHILSTLQQAIEEFNTRRLKHQKATIQKESSIELLSKPLNKVNESLQLLIKKQQLNKIKENKEQVDINAMKSVYNLIIKRLDREKTELVNKNIHLEKELITDKLTGLKTRGILDIRLKQEFTTSKARNKPLSVIMLDIDHFKAVNDNYGHQIGDKVLQDVSRIIINLCSLSMVPARYGGEEITIICPGYTKEKAENFANNIRESIEKNLKYDESFCKPVTISAGVATYTGETSINAADILLKNADIALYEAKDNGRNQVKTYNC